MGYPRRRKSSLKIHFDDEISHFNSLNLTWLLLTSEVELWLDPLPLRWYWWSTCKDLQPESILLSPMVLELFMEQLEKWCIKTIRNWMLGFLTKTYSFLWTNRLYIFQKHISGHLLDVPLWAYDFSFFKSNQWTSITWQSSHQFILLVLR